MITIKVVGVVGAGTMGNGIAHVFARGGFQVVLCEVEQRFLDRGLEAIRKNYIDDVNQNKLLDGAFKGKVGVIQQLDGKGGARVMLGLLAVRIDVKDLASCSGGRAGPRLSSSHRKPQPVRS